MDFTVDDMLSLSCFYRFIPWLKHYSLLLILFPSYSIWVNTALGEHNHKQYTTDWNWWELEIELNSRKHNHSFSCKKPR